MMVGVRSKLKWFPWVALVIVVAILLYQRRAQSHVVGPVPTGVELATVERGTQQQKIAATGIVASQTGAQVRIGSQITGRIRSLPADVGTHVRANQIVAELDLPDLQAQVEQIRHTVAASEAALAQAASRYKQSVEAAGLNADQTKAQIAQADAALKAAEAHVESAGASSKQQPIQTTADIARAQASLSSAKSAEKQVEETIKQQNQQAQANLDEAQAVMETAKRTLARQQALAKKGYIADDIVDQSDAAYKQSSAKVQNMQAALDIMHSKLAADLQSAHDQVSQAQAVLDSAKSEKMQDQAHLADLKNAIEIQKQAIATLALQTSGQRTDLIKKMAIGEAHSAMLQAEATLLQTKSQLKFQLDQLDKTIIRSPISGTVLSITAQQGETVAAGLAAPTLITVADLDRLEVRAYVDETDIGHIHLNVPAEVRVEAFPGQVFHGKVTKIASASTTKDNVVTYETTIAVANTGGLLRPDMTADVSLILSEHPNVLLIPSESVHREVRRTVVYVLHKEKPESERVEVRPVQPGFDDGAQTEIKTGLQAGDQVVVAGLPRLGVRAPDAQGSAR